ncbi:MAG: 50S ribosomal protein L13 [Bacteriovoracaceae bacterium]|nr:50S ribosomal protein L13 [Bacteriovoracaceae bacterium]
MYTQKSFVLKPAEVQKKWYLIDAKDQVVGRLATSIASILRGKINPQYTPNTDSGDFVVVVNANKVSFTGDKWDKKIYHWHTGHIGGLKQRTAREQLKKHPEKILMDAVKGMLPKNSLGRKQLKKLKVFIGQDHSHQAQNPEVYEIR